MKKSVSIIIIVISIFLTPITSLAADGVISGELDFGKNFTTARNIGKATFTVTSQISDSTHATIDLTADWAANSSYAGRVLLDDATIEFDGELVTLTYGFFDYDATEIELLDPDSLNEDNDDSELTANLSVGLSRQSTLLLSVAAPPNGLDYSAGITFNFTNTSAGFTLSKNAADADGSYIINGSYTIKAFKIYLTMQNHLSGGPDTESLVVGTRYESDTNPCYGSVEYDLERQGHNSHNSSLCMGYKIYSSIRFEYNWTHQNSNTGSDDQNLKMCVCF